MLNILKALQNVGFVIILLMKVTGKYRGASNINVNVNYENTMAFHTLKNYEAHLIMQELGKFNFKINVMPNGLKIYEF